MLFRLLHLPAYIAAVTAATGSFALLLKAADNRREQRSRTCSSHFRGNAKLPGNRIEPATGAQHIHHIHQSTLP